MERKLEILFRSALTIIALAWTLSSLSVIPVGDDLAYGQLLDDYHGGSIRWYPQWIASHWLHSNGRLANLIAPLFLRYLPIWILKALSGAMLALMVWLVTKLTVKTPVGRLIVLFCLSFTLPWWDKMLMADLQLNYVWASVAILAFSYCILNNRSGLGPIFIAFAAGMFHESASLPILLAIIIYRLAGHRFSSASRPLIFSFAFATLLAVVSPGIISRALADKTPDDPCWLIILKSDFLTLILLAVIPFTRKKALRKLSTDSPWLFWLSAAIFATLLSASSGIVGRSGWFAQIYALIALALFTKQILHPKIIPALSVVLAILTASQWCVAAYCQICISAPAWHSIYKAYTSNPSAIVWADIPDDNRLMTLGKTLGTPDLSDEYTLSTLSRLTGSRLLILPPKIADIHSDSILPDGSSISRKKPIPSPAITTVEYFDATLNDSLYYSYPRRCHWGDR